jgi:hypothetical protein
LKESLPLFKVSHYSEDSLEKIAIDFGKLGIRVVVEDRWSLFRGLSVFIFPRKHNLTRPAWAGFKTAEEGIAIIMSNIL